jgi:hypothetical protein
VLYFATASGPSVREAMRSGWLGQITTPASANALEPGVTWCADNGIYSRAYPGDSAYLTWLRRQSGAERCAFAVAPDVVADHTATYERGWPMFRRIREILPVAMCAQNGATPDDMPWDYIDAVFLAGVVECLRCDWVPPVAELPMTHCPNLHRMTEWKTSDMAHLIAARARAEGKWVHMGRVNTLGRIVAAQGMGCDSVDGTFLTYGPDKNLIRLRRYMDESDRRDLWQPLF